MQITTNIPSHGNGQIQNPDAVPSQGRADLQQNGELSLANAAKGSVFQGKWHGLQRVQAKEEHQW